MNTMNASIIGMGKLGASMAVAMAKRGCRVVGVDVNPEAIRKLNAGQSPVEETGVQELLDKYRRRILATPDVETAVRASEVTFIVVATPSQADGAFSNHQLLPAVEKIGAALRGKRDFHIVVITCTVMPGTTDGVVRPLLEKSSGKRCGRDFALVYNPEFIALGSVVRDFLNPDFVLMGTREEKARKMMEAFYARVCENKPPIRCLTPTEAEIGKIALNCFCTMKISFANMLAELAENGPGVDARAISQAIGLDRRIGQNYLAPGLGFGGPCFPRDNVAFQTFARKQGIEVPLPAATQAVNRRQSDRVLARIKAILPRGGVVAVLGLSYKPCTPVVEESQALEIAVKVAGLKGFKVRVYDPQAMPGVRGRLPAEIRDCDSVQDCLTGADLMVLATPWPEFAAVKARDVKKWMRHPAVLDCWRCWSPGDGVKGIRYWATGLGGEMG